MRLLVQGPGSGGVGKTSVVELIHSTALSRGERVLLVDADIANRSLTERLGKEAVGVMLRDWTHLDGAAVAVIGRAAQEGCSTIVVDMGASAAALPEVDAFLGDLLEAAGGAGYHPCLSIAAVPGKPGLRREVERLLRALPPGVASALALVNKDGSGAHREFEGVHADAVVSVPHLMPGLLAVRRLRTGPFLDAVLHPPPGYARAAGMLAQALLPALTCPEWAAAFGSLGHGTCEALAQAATAAPRRWYQGRGTLAEVTDAALARDERLLQAYARLDALRPGMPDAALLSAARGLVEARHAAA